MDQLQRACDVYGANAADARLLHSRSNAIYLLPHEQIVVRLAPATSLRQQRAATVIEVTRWLATQPNPTALSPTPGNQPITTDAAVATFWPYRPTGITVSPTDLGQLLKKLHQQPTPPFAIPPYRPLHRLREALLIDGERTEPILASHDAQWLADQADRLIEQFTGMDTPLGTGLVHADVHAENVILDAGRWLLIDFDHVCTGPRELDLVSGLPDHFQEPEARRAMFLAAYGQDLTSWPGWTVFRDITELHSLSAYVRLASTSSAARHELHKRIRSLRTGDRTISWQSIS
ncbi:phosphotransferase enzyme family protein [Lentzea sp. NPDC059081]|uniref:phosphotransferase enzyme family protein n=1 Tax=Lentzea sp. NPDC059081 TaxID=3346719 RepID=UPI003692527D